jgi:hypothetical protein
MAPNSLVWIVGALGILAAGGVLVPVAAFDESALLLSDPIKTAACDHVIFDRAPTGFVAPRDQRQPLSNDVHSVTFSPADRGVRLRFPQTEYKSSISYSVRSIGPSVLSQRPWFSRGVILAPQNPIQSEAKTQLVEHNRVTSASIS